MALGQDMFEVDLTKDVRAASRLFTPQWRIALVIVTSGLFVFAFRHFGQGVLALPVWSGIAALTLALATKWEFRRYAWFWIAMSALVLLHVPVVVLVIRWEGWVSVKGFVLLAVADWLGMTLILGFIGSTMGIPRRTKRPGQGLKAAARSPRDSR